MSEDYSQIVSTDRTGRTCSDCRFCNIGYKPEIRYDPSYECRRRAPAPKVHASDLGVGAYWPLVSPDEWCGEWKEIEKTENTLNRLSLEERQYLYRVLLCMQAGEGPNWEADGILHRALTEKFKVTF